MTQFVANPVIIDAFVITNVADAKEDGSRNLMLDDGSIYNIPASEISRIIPVVGDYIVKSKAMCLIPKTVLEANYNKINLFNSADQSPEAQVKIDDFQKCQTMASKLYTLLISESKEVARIAHDLVMKFL